MLLKQIKWMPVALFAAGIFACGDPASAPQAKTVVRGNAPYPFKMVDDNIHHDTLLIQTTFDLGDESYLMVASSVEETFEGLRLYRYHFDMDSEVVMMAVSPPAYDSWTMLPTFFPMDTAEPEEDMWVLANFGEKESWGQKLLWLDYEFSDMGFMDVALPERVMEDDTLRLKRRNIGPHVRYEEHNDTSYFRFACDSVFIYVTHAGQADTVLPASQLYYTFHRQDGLALWLNGHKNPVKKPA